MYTIFINDLTLRITKNEPAQGVTKVVEGDPRSWIEKHWKSFNSKRDSGSIYVVADDPTEFWEALKERFTRIEAAGGLVTNTNGEILFIKRLGKWDLPKGKLESGEDIPTCALREVEEECGITGHRILEEMPSTYHTYKLGDTHIMKKTYWFWMKVEGSPDLTPQTEEDITETVWLKEREWSKVEKNTYPSIKSLLETYRIRYK